MSYVRYKIRNGNKYAYEVSSYWDSELKRSRQKSTYLGTVGSSGEITPTGDRKRYAKESLILDFGDAFCLHAFVQQSKLFKPLSLTFNKKDLAHLLPLMFYRILLSSAMHNCDRWLEGSVLRYLYKADLSSQNISRMLTRFGNEAVQRKFFDHYLTSIERSKKSVIIDATALPNNIHLGMSTWGYADGGIERQFRLMCVLDSESKLPLFYRYLPGNLTDVSTLEQTIAELTAMGVENSFALIDAGYFSESNIKALYKRNIHFLTRLPAGRMLYKELISAETRDLESISYATKYGSRGLFVKSVSVELYGQKAFAYLVLDPARKGKEMNSLLLESLEKDASPIDSLEFNKCGVMVLIASKKIPESEVVAAYYMRQSVEQVFGFCKDDLNILPIRRHSEDTVRGYLF